MQLGHAILENADVLLLPCVDKGLDISGFILFQHLDGKHTELHLEQIHQEATGTPVSVGPGMNGHQLVVRPETEVIDSADV